MGTASGGPSPHFSTWHLASAVEPGISSSDDEDSTGSIRERKVNVFTGYGRPGASQVHEHGLVGRRFGKPFSNSRWPDRRQAPTGRDVYWSSTGPKTESRKLMGYTLDLPVLAPMTAPPEDKKLILTQTVDRIADAGVGDWPSKTTLLTQRFAMAVPNATNEAKVRLAKFKDFTSDMFVFGPPIGLMSDMQFTPLHQTVVLRYLSFELRVLSKLAPPVDAPVPNLPGERCIQAIMKVPLNEQQTDVHNCCTQERLGNVKSLIEAMIQEGLERTIGKHSMVSRSLDTMLFDKEFKMVYGEAMFRAVTAVLLRDYVGKGITKDIQKRLRDCKQVAYIAGKRRVKSVEEQHADFMRLVQEFDVDEQIPANLPSIAFHNASYDIQQELQHMKYEPPSECSSIAEQYKKLSEFHLSLIHI